MFYVRKSEASALAMRYHETHWSNYLLISKTNKSMSGFTNFWQISQLVPGLAATLRYHQGSCTAYQGAMYRYPPSSSRIRLSLLAVNFMDIKSLTRNRVITKGFSFYKNTFLILILFYTALIYFSILWSYLFKQLFNPFIDPCNF